MEMPADEKHCGHNDRKRDPNAWRWRPEWRLVGNNYVPQVTQTIRVGVHFLSRPNRHAEQASYLIDDVTFVAYHQ